MSRKKAMAVFTESHNHEYSSDWRTDILDSIALTGTAEADVKISLARRSQILAFNSSRPRIKPNLVGRFALILSRPAEINTTVQCCICGRTINFNNAPVWYYLIKYNVNCFAAFVCFDSASPSKPSVKCYRRE